MKTSRWTRLRPCRKRPRHHQVTRPQRHRHLSPLSPPSRLNPPRQRDPRLSSLPMHHRKRTLLGPPPLPRKRLLWPRRTPHLLLRQMRLRLFPFCLRPRLTAAQPRARLSLKPPQGCASPHPRPRHRCSRAEPARRQRQRFLPLRHSQRPQRQRQSRTAPNCRRHRPCRRKNKRWWMQTPPPRSPIRRDRTRRPVPNQSLSARRPALPTGSKG